MIPYGRQLISDEDIQAVVDVLRSDFLTQGPMVPTFERSIAEYCHVAHAVAVNSATSALHIACLALDLGPGDILWTSPNTFVASANCGRYCGAKIDFVDINPDTLTMCPLRLSEKLQAASRDGKLPKVVVPVHFAGLPCDMREIYRLSQEFGFRIIEDASHAIGARYADTIVGDCEFSDITVFSFHPVKIITTAEGGAATTASPVIARRLQMLRSHGITREELELRTLSEGAWYYEQQSLGYNYRLTEIQAALGVTQLQHLDTWVKQRHAIADRYDVALGRLPIKLPPRPAGMYSGLHLYCVQIDNRRHVFDELRAAGIGVNVHYIPVHLQPDFAQFGFRPGQFPASEHYYSRAISLPMYASLSQADQDYVINQVVRLLK